ncbi:Amino acid transporter AVT1B [Chionoecetes opilio]|uniref:Amino acid transporter AVT1B n=1 Tax=Chionoecetes opilio TaxID=41210 RepID=A0A8J5CJI7_CHIOP|nr:Amino acid transporter AVT1B [Chionoecetes opilio]
MASHTKESARIYTTAHTTYSGKAETPAALAESTEICFRDDVYEASGSGEGGGTGGGRATKGLSMPLASIFLIAEMAGAGILSLPHAVANTGWVGVPLMMVMSLGVGFAGTRLGKCWVILEQRWPEYRAPCRRPYQAIAFRALGRPGQIAAEVSLTLTLSGAAIVYLLLAAQVIHDLMGAAVPLSQCEWCLVLGVLLLPTTWLSTPKDFWGAPLLALGATLLACLVVVVEVVLDKDHEPPEFTAPTFKSFFLGFGAILFALGGSSIFPTIQNDMKNRAQFPDSVVITFLVLLAIYLPVCAITYGILGSNGLPANILQAVRGPAVKVTQVFILCHFLFAFAIVLNPVNQALESVFKVPADVFGIKRVFLRTCVMVVIILIGLTIPDFSKILDLIGGSTVVLMSFVLPPLCFLRLNAATTLTAFHTASSSCALRILPKWEVATLVVVMVVGVVGSIASTWSALDAIISEQSFNTTCFSPKTFLYRSTAS